MSKVVHPGTPDADTGFALEARCTCQCGRDIDGSEFGPCAHCERVGHEEAERRAMTWDALRWRFSQRPGFGVVRSYEFSEVESNVVAVSLGRTKVGCGTTLQMAVDCALYLTSEHGDDVPLDVWLRFCRAHFACKRNAGAWVMPEAPRFELDDDGRMYLAEPTREAGGRTGGQNTPGMPSDG